MRCFTFAPQGSAYTLEAGTRPEPVAQPGRVIVQVRAVSLNYRDLTTLRNKAGRNVAGRIPCSDGVGEVVAVGPGVDRVRVGDRVAGCFFQTWIDGPFELRHHQADLGGTIDGMLTEYADLAADGVVHVPDHLTDEEAACYPCAGVTAWYSLVTRGGLQPGETVLTLGTGGVSVFAAQIAHLMGATVIMTSSQDAKLERARELGVTHTINYRTHPEWEKQVWSLTNKRGVDQVIEVGGPGTLGKSMSCVAPGGQIALIGVLSGFGPPTESLFPLMARNANLAGIYVGSRTDFESLNAFVRSKGHRPIIDRVFSWENAMDAFTYLESGAHFGKIVIRVSESRK